MNTPKLEPTCALYNISHWGDGYFEINDHGHLIVRPNRKENGPSVDLYELITTLRNSGLALPVLVRFSDILRNRVQRLITAFANAGAAFSYCGKYTPVYPIKVNQQRHVVEQILAASELVGLEAGTKPELMAVLALSRPDGLIICNGYKDREYIRRALFAFRLGLRALIVIEKPSELELVISESAALKIKPRIGVRVRLASISAGKWQNSGGAHAKFGLEAAQVLTLIERLKIANLTDCLELMHFHLGSQVANIRDLQNGLREAARYYAALRRIGAPITLIDVGGGLGVDYEGTASRSFCSINYTLQEYANDVVQAFATVCAQENLPHPDLITESGRAMTAHHAVLLTHVVDIERSPEDQPEPPAPDAPPLLHDLWAGFATVDAHSALEVYHDAVHWQAEAQARFDHGLLDLAHRAAAERLYNATCARVRALLQADAGARRNREVLDELNERHADKYFVNFSLFQSLPDSWAIQQVFPVVPLHRLDETPTRRAVLADLTCDSDGQINLYVAAHGVETTLPLHPWEPGQQPYFLGIFLIGAYQEILGDLHNLFGDTNAVNVELTERGWRLVEPIPGDTVSDVLSAVHFTAPVLLARLRAKLLDNQHLATNDLPTAQLFAELAAGLNGYTYLAEDQSA